MCHILIGINSEGSDLGFFCSVGVAVDSLPVISPCSLVSRLVSSLSLASRRNIVITASGSSYSHAVVVGVYAEWDLL